MSVFKFNFNNTISRIPQKKLQPQTLSQGLIMVKLEVTNPEYSGVTAYPYKYLPVMLISDEKVHGGAEGIVMPKGTIVSLVTNQTTIASGIPVPSASGVIPVYNDAVTGDLVTMPIDGSFYGYDESLTALLVPANGGANSTIPYSALDDAINSWAKSTNDPLQIAANIPLGIVLADVYQDIRGKYLNYQTHDAYSTVISGRMNIPFVDTSKIEGFGSAADILAQNPSAYAAVWKKWAFYYFDGSASQARSGALLKSDLYGKFITESAAVGAQRTVQTVGYVQSLDCRWPKELAGMIQTYYDTRLMGVNTAGLPTDLYLFAYETLGALDMDNSPEAILARVRDGAFGYARIQLSK